MKFELSAAVLTCSISSACGNIYPLHGDT